MKTSLGEFAWKDDETKMIFELSANQYIRKLMNNIKLHLENPFLCPINGNFPNYFVPFCIHLFRRLSRVFQHLFE